MNFFTLVPFFVLIVIIVIAAYAVITWRRRESEPETDPGIGTVRRLYFYIVSFVALMMSISGVVLVVQFILDSLFGGPVVTPSSAGLAGGASLAIVGVPLWLFHWRFVQRYVAGLPVETRSLIRKLYVYIVLGVSGSLFLNGVVQIIQWALRTEDFGGYHWGALVVGGAVWLYHWRAEEAEGQPTADTLGVRRLYLYLVSLVTLIMLAFGLDQIIDLMLSEGYNALAEIPVLLPQESGLWSPAIRNEIATALAGGAAWALHWLYFARHDYGSALRQVYLYVFAVLGGIVTVLISLGIIIFGLLEWLLKVPPVETAEMHFQFLPGSLAALSIGLGLWVYHWMVVQREAGFSAQESQAARRSYTYILSALGLAALAVAVFTVVSMFLGIVVSSFTDLIAGRDIWRGPLAIVITLSLLGLPIWAYYWFSAQRQVSVAGVGEQTALSRRIFIFAALGAGVLALLGSVSTLLFFVLGDFLDAGLSLETLRDITTPVSVIVAALVFLPYYWGVYQQDREAGPEAGAAPVRKDVSVLVGQDGGEFVRRLEAALGHRVMALRWADPDAALPELSDDAYQQLAARIAQTPGPRVLLIPDGATVRVLSYR
jgi:hypothetical protein